VSVPGRSRTWRTRAIVLDHTKLGETDLILTLLAEDGSQVRAVAKGGRKPGGKLAGRCGLFCECDLLLAHGRSLDVVAEASLEEPHVAIAGDLDRMSAASMVAEVARLTCFEDAPDPWLAPACSRALAACCEAEGRASLMLVAAAYAMKTLSHQGWMPQLDSCVACGDLACTWFSASAGGVLCDSCARGVEGAEMIDARTLEWARSLLTMTFDDLVACEVDDATAYRLLSLAHVWCATHLDSRLRAFEFTLSV
jgi:DNA repair protein RecO (recombination protein O)